MCDVKEVGLEPVNRLATRHQGTQGQSRASSTRSHGGQEEPEDAKVRKRSSNGSLIVGKPEQCTAQSKAESSLPGCSRKAELKIDRARRGASMRQKTDSDVSSIRSRCAWCKTAGTLTLDVPAEWRCAGWWPRKRTPLDQTQKPTCRVHGRAHESPPSDDAKRGGDGLQALFRGRCAKFAGHRPTMRLMARASRTV